MKPKTLLVLAIVTALLGGYIYFFERELPSTDEKKDLEKRVVTVEPADVQTVTLRSGDAEVRLEKVTPEPKSTEDDDEAADGGEPEPEPEWRLTAPIEARAARFEVDQLLGDLTGLEIEREVGEVDSAAAGLDAPRAEVTLTTEDGETTLALGVEVPLSSDALVRVDTDGDEGESSRVVQTGFGAALLEKIQREAGDWRDKRLFFGRRSDVQSLSWTSADGQRVVLLRRGDGETFWLESPIQDRADADKVRGLLSSLTALEAESFVDGALDFQPAGRFEATLAGYEEPWLVELAQAAGDAGDTDDTGVQPLARVDGQIVRLEPGPMLDAVASAPADWRSRAWTDLQTFQVEEAILDQAGQELLGLRRKESDWLRTTGDAARVGTDADGELQGDEVPYTAASNVLYGLTDAQAESLADRSPSGEPRDPLLTVTLVGKDGEETLRLFPAGEDGLYPATAGDRDAVLLLSAETVDELLANVQVLRDAEPLPPPDLTADDEVASGDRE